jgi:hypothetical protein
MMESVYFDISGENRYLLLMFFEEIGTNSEMYVGSKNDTDSFGNNFKECM